MYRPPPLSRPAEIVIATGTLDTLNETEKYSLASLADHPSVSVREVSALPGVAKGTILAEVRSVSLATRWASTDAGAAGLNERWGETASPVILASGLGALNLDGRNLDPSSIRPKRVDAGDREIVIHHQLDGTLQGFGSRFWKAIAAEHKVTQSILDSTGSQVSSVEYSDRYLFTPLSVAVLLEIITGLRDLVGRDRWENPTCKIITTVARPTGENRAFGTIYSDWADSDIRNKVLVGAFAYLGIEAHLQVPDKPAVKHGRTLDIIFSDGVTLTIRFDQGVSYWRAPTLSGGRRIDVSFAFGTGQPDGLVGQSKRVAELSVPVEGARHPTELFAKARARK